jgi:DNA mismatch endonuclease, patch repair protein
MTDTLSPAERSERMARVRSRHTKPELRVRTFLHGAGLRYRLHRRVEGTRPDMVFASRRVALFVHGCIWHRHPDPACPFTRTPKSRIAFWEAKFAENVARDARQRATLEAAGWTVMVIWECETRNNERLAGLAAAILGASSAHPYPHCSCRSDRRAR